MDMPAAGFLTDEQLAAVLTYVRREWGNEASPVEPSDVARQRAAHAGRQDAWTTELLLK
jgi:mono/diheme cytochrome c family protein